VTALLAEECRSGNPKVGVALFIQTLNQIFICILRRKKNITDVKKEWKLRAGVLPKPDQ
jgi:hypothetical protein